MTGVTVLPFFLYKSENFVNYKLHLMFSSLLFFLAPLEKGISFFFPKMVVVVVKLIPGNPLQPVSAFAPSTI